MDTAVMMYDGIVGKPGEESIVFTSKRTLQLIRRDDYILSDATYYITPETLGAEQTFIVAVIKYGSVSKFHKTAYMLRPLLVILCSSSQQQEK